MESGRVKLSVSDVSLKFGGVTALSNVSLDVKDGEILAIVGPNGAGKTCLLNCISGFYRPQQGDLFFEGKNITRLPSYKIAQLGIARTFQNIELYTGLTTLDNIMTGRHVRMHSNVLDGAVFFGRAGREDLEHRAVVEDILKFLEIEHLRKAYVGALPYGFRKRVELGRALALEPKLLLLDEPMAGMNVEEKEDMARFIYDISELRKIPMLLIEHDMGVVMDISDRVVVLNFGRKIAEGTPDVIQKDPLVIKAYFGEDIDAETTEKMGVDR